jgi:uncharacterized protein YbbC (DUF1343 family)
MQPARVRTGLEVLAGRGFDLLKGRRVGLIANHTAVDGGLAHAADRLRQALGPGLVRLFGPEHGLRGAAQDMIAVDGARDPATGLEVVSLYGRDQASLTPPAAKTADLDLLVFDVQDVGSRYYTFQATMQLAMAAAAARGLELVVLDRPNPIGGTRIEGNSVAEGFRSFVGLAPIAVRHGMTVGELARLYRATLPGHDCALTVVAMEGWEGRGDHAATGLPWVAPSPNMPSPATALVYPGMCLVEGTNLSEGRGTTQPFELFGAPWIDPRRLRAELEREELPGVRFREAWFQPMFHKHGGESCGGVQLHVTDRETFLPFLTGVAAVRAARALDPRRFAWRAEAYEFVSERLAFDLLCGGEEVRRGIEAGAPLAEIAAGWTHELEEFRARREAALMYR